MQSYVGGSRPSALLNKKVFFLLKVLTRTDRADMTVQAVTLIPLLRSDAVIEYMMACSKCSVTHRHHDHTGHITTGMSNPKQSTTGAQALYACEMHVQLNN